MVKGRVNGKPKGRHVYSEEFRQEAHTLLGLKRRL